MKIRKCTIADCKTLVEISLTTFVEAFEKDNNPNDFKAYIDVAFSEHNLMAQLNDPDSSFYFVSLKGELVGYFKLNENGAQNELKTGDTIELERIYVYKDFQGQGLGATMLREIIRMAMEKKKKQLWLGVWENNVGAIRFYEKHGFAKFGTHPYFVGKDKQTDWLMGFTISGMKKPLRL